MKRKLPVGNEVAVSGQASPRDAPSAPLDSTQPQSLASQRPESAPVAANPATSPSSAPSASRTRVVSPHREGDTGELDEASLVWDLLDVFHGTDGKFIKLSTQDDCYQIDSKVASGKADLCQTSTRLAELGCLHNKVRKYIVSKILNETTGLISSTFYNFLNQELEKYYQLLSDLNSQLQVVGVYTFPRLLAWWSTARDKLRTLAALIDLCQDQKGSKLASTIHAYKTTGPPPIMKLVQRLQFQVSLLYIDFLDRWMHDGNVQDPYEEFFIESKPQVKPDRLWYDMYSLRTSRIPSFITMDQARKVLLSGKSVNFLQKVCLETMPPRSQSVDRNNDELMDNVERAFVNKIDAAYIDTTRFLQNVIMNKYELMEHLQVLRKYMLLGSENFTRLLFGSLRNLLNESAYSLFKHELAAEFRKVVGEVDKSGITQRLDVHIQHVSPGDTYHASFGDTGWDVFSLDYRVDGPLAMVLTRECMDQYKQVFHFLWQAKRLEYTDTDISQSVVYNAQLLESIPGLSEVLDKCSSMVEKMTYFNCRVVDCVNSEVLECSWNKLCCQLKQPQDLDGIIAAHEAFLKNILKGCLLDNKESKFQKNICKVFDLNTRCQHTRDSLYSVALKEILWRKTYDQQQHTEDEEAEEKKRRQNLKKTIQKMDSKLSTLATHFQKHDPQTRHHLYVHLRSFRLS